MILESFTIDKGKYKLSGISLLPWLDNRFVRTSAKHDDEHWYIENKVPGEILWIIVYNMCCQGSPYLSGSIPIGISNPQRFIIPGLGLRDYDKSGIPVKVGVPYGPVYKALKEIATSYKIGMQITLDDVTDTSYSLGFRSYKGIDQSIAALKTVVYTFAPGLKPDEGSPDLRTTPGVSELSGPDYVGFDLLALQEFEVDISTDQVGGSPQNLVDILNSRAFDKLIDNQFVKSVDGEIVPDSQFKYGIHYNLGDLI